MYGDKEFTGYDQRGFVVRRGQQRYTYNSFGKMTSASEPGRFSVKFYYDDIGRIIAKRDHRANVVQFIYTNPYANSTVSYVHYPKASRTYHLLYDENDVVIAMDTPDRYYTVIFLLITFNLRSNIIPNNVIAIKQQITPIIELQPLLPWN